MFESAIAVGSALAALSAGIAAMVPPSIDIYHHLLAVQQVNAALKDQIPILGGGFRDMAEGAANASHVLEAFGGIVNAVSGQTGVFAHIATEVVAGIDDWIAKIDLFMAHQSNTGKLLQDGVGFLHQFEQAVDNVAVAISHLLTADPGTAHYLMDIVVGATKVLDVITELPAPMLEAALALHSFWLWGGLMGTGIGNLLGPLRAMALGMGEVRRRRNRADCLGGEGGRLDGAEGDGRRYRGRVRVVGRRHQDGGDRGRGAEQGRRRARVGVLVREPGGAGVAALAAGIGFLTYEMLQSSEASQKFGAAVNQALTQDSATQFLAQVPAAAGAGVGGADGGARPADGRVEVLQHRHAQHGRGPEERGLPRAVRERREGDRGLLHRRRQGAAGAELDPATTPGRWRTWTRGRSRSCRTRTG